MPHGRRQECAGTAKKVERLTGFCLLARREVLDQIGGFDERYGLGFFDDDDLSVRARQAGFVLLLAEDVFIHHFGNRTFQALGVDCRAQLKSNFAQFKAKWGAASEPLFRYVDPPLNARSDMRNLERARHLGDAIWRRLPLAATARMGDMVYRHL